jgi:ferric-dicitrate binding protein FerR (iron transport regulator)
MVPSEVFMEHATECECMAKFSRDPENKEVWRRMAQRWMRCAAFARQQDPSLQARRKIRMRRKPALTTLSSDRTRW